MNVPAPPPPPSSDPPAVGTPATDAARVQQRCALIDSLHATPWRLVMAVTGGGSRAISDLLARPGASATLLSASVPYSAAALQAFLGYRPTDAAASAATARQMAMRAYVMARALDAPDDAADGNWAGIACTAALPTGRARRGAERAHVAIQTRHQTSCWSLQLQSGLRDRGGAESLVADLILHALGSLCDRPLKLALTEGDLLQADHCRPPQPCVDLLHGQADLVSISDGDWSTARCRSTPVPAGSVPLTFSGSFNPLHEGHLQMARLASRLTGTSVAWELSIENADKPPLDYLTLRDRVAQFALPRADAETSPPEPATGADVLSSAPLLLTRASRFMEKARLLPGTTFIAGADTVLRLDQPRYYGDSSAARDQAIEQIRQSGCRLLVFGRLTDQGFADAEHLQLSPRLAALCQPIAATAFRNDISSTTLRTGGAPERL